MEEIRIAAAQFEVRNADKEYNLGVMSGLVEEAVKQGADIISFPEVCIPAYSFMRKSSREEIGELSEAVPGSASVKRLMEMSNDFRIAILAGLIEREGDQ